MARGRFMAPPGLACAQVSCDAPGRRDHLRRPGRRQTFATRINALVPAESIALCGRLRRGGVMSTAAECRKYAENCVELAQTAKSEHHRTMLLEMAEK